MMARASPIIPDAALSQHTAVVAQTGAGKSYATRGIVERLLEERRRVCVVDYTGVWWGLRSSASGKSSGYPIVIFGGEHGDVPLNEAAAPVVAKFVAAGDVPTIVDLDGMTVGAQQRFVTAFLEELYRLNSRPLHLVIEEIDEFAPQTGARGTERMIGATARIFQRGRRKGFRAVAITQRPQNTHKRVLAQCKTLIALQLMHPLDVTAVEDWVRGHADPRQAKEFAEQLAGLQTGEGFVWSPQQRVFERVKFPRIKTFDSMAAPDERPAEGPARFADVDLPALRAQMADLVQEAEANDPAKMKADLAARDKRIAELERAADARPTVDPQARLAGERAAYTIAMLRKALEAAVKFIVEINAQDFFRAGGEAVDRAAIEKAIAAAVDHATRLIEGNLEQRGREIEKARREAESLVAKLKALLDQDVTLKVDVRHNEPFTITPARAAPRPPAKAGPSSDGAADASLTRPQARVLEALAWWEAMGIAEPTRAQLAGKIGWSVRSGNYRDRLGELNRAGLIEYPTNGCVRLTDAGRVIAPAPDTAQTAAESVRAMLSNPQRRLFEQLLAHGRAMTREALAEAVGWTVTSGNFRDRLGELHRLEVIEYPAKGEVRAVGWVL